MRCNYCLGDDANDLVYYGKDKNGATVELFYHKTCWHKVQTKVLDMICKNELDIKEEEE